MNSRKYSDLFLYRKSRRYAAVIFDMDGVIVNSEPYYVDLEQITFRQLGLKISTEEHQTYKGTATDRMWQIIKNRHGIDHPLDSLVEMTNNKVTPFFNSLKKIEPINGVENLIHMLKAGGVPIALASSSYPEIIEIILQKSGLKGYFDVIVDSKMARSSKPDPAIFLLAAKNLGINPDDCIAIEDSANGIRAAKSAGMYCIAYAGQDSELQNQSEADEIITDFSLF
jgi:beta-phosphoglucomutase